jgi:hypothetical protein
MFLEKEVGNRERKKTEIKTIKRKYSNSGKNHFTELTYSTVSTVQAKGSEH